MSYTKKTAFLSFIAFCGILGLRQADWYLDNGRLLLQEKMPTSDDTPLSLYPGELPGYTGWPRPESTLAGYFQFLEPLPESTVQVGTKWTAKWHCQDYKCSNNTWFYARAYGPAIVGGRVERVDSNGTIYYQLDLNLVDPGLYTIEVVVAYSHAPSDLSKFPYATEEEENQHLFEGYMVAGFPFSLRVTLTEQPVLPHCTVDDIAVSSVDEGLDRARWKLVQSNSHYTHNASVSSRVVSYDSYKSSSSCLGHKFDYKHKTCRWKSPSDYLLHRTIADQKNASNFFCKDGTLHQDRTRVHLVMIGDSVMNLQKELLLSRFLKKKYSDQDKLRISFWDVSGGILQCVRKSGSNVTKLLSDSSLKRQNEKLIVIWNTGLHEIHNLCGIGFLESRSTYLTEQELQSPCTEQYKKSLDIITSAIDKASPDLVIYQTTSSAWHKYGNFGVSWSPLHGQVLPLDSEFIYRFNAIAIDLVTKQFSDWKIVDNFWPSYSRPDNREIGTKAQIGKKMAHPGLEVAKVLVRQWLDVIIFTLCV